MKTRTLKQITLASSIMIFAGASLALPPAAQVQVKPRSQSSKVLTKAIAPLTPETTQGLIHMREEEKIARDVYAVLRAQWNAQVFNITNSEQNHMGAMANLLALYNLPDPITDDTIGVFQTPAFAELYAYLLELGSTSVVDAYKVGALIEELDLVDIRHAIVQANDPAIIAVYGELMRGTRNHLRSYASKIYAAGETYEAQYLSQEEFDAIAASDREPGGG